MLLPPVPQVTLTKDVHTGGFIDGYVDEKVSMKIAEPDFLGLDFAATIKPVMARTPDRVDERLPVAIGEL